MIISDYYIIITIYIFVLQRKKLLKNDLLQGSNTISTPLIKIRQVPRLWFAQCVRHSLQSNKTEPFGKGPQRHMRSVLHMS